MWDVKMSLKQCKNPLLYCNHFCIVVNFSGHSHNWIISLLKALYRPTVCSCRVCGSLIDIISSSSDAAI